MILPDINLLIYAYNSSDPQHSAAREWWDRSLTGSVGIYLPWVCILGFIRVITNRRIFPDPFPPDEATGRVEEWLGLPHVQIVEPARGHFSQWKGLLSGLGTAGNLTTDAHLAAIAITRRLTLHTTDADFARFPGLKWKNPLL